MSTQVGDLRLPARFWTKVTPSEAGCWIWTSAQNERGYPLFWHQGRAVRAHRIAYESLVAVAPDGLEIDHLCRIKICVNPAHLEAVTPAENVRRRYVAYRASQKQAVA